MEYNGTDTHVVIPDTVTAIGDSAFWSNSAIETLEIPGSVKQIGNNAFSNCAGLTFVNMEEGIETIGSAFTGCSSLEDINLPESVTAIDEIAFLHCNDLTIHTPAGSYAEDYAYNHKLSSDQDLAVYEEDASAGTKIKADQYAYKNFETFEIDADVTEICAEAFQYCKFLKEITIPGNVQTIGPDAFEYCETLKTVVIEEGCTELKDGAFQYCKSLKDITIPASVEEIADSALEYCSDSLTIHTPKGSYAEQYAQANDIAYDNNL